MLAKWSDETLQRQLCGLVQHVVSVTAIPDKLRRQGFKYNFKEWCVKIKALKKQYKETVDSLRQSGVSMESEDNLEDVHIKFSWFSEIHGVIGSRAAVNPPELLDMLLRSVWTRSRSQAFTEVISAWDDLEWKRNFCVSRRTFWHLCNELCIRLLHDSTLRQIVTVEKRVAVALWRLGTNVGAIFHLFGIGMSTACNIVHELCRAIMECLLSKYVKIPQKMML